MIGVERRNAILSCNYNNSGCLFENLYEKIEGSNSFLSGKYRRYLRSPTIADAILDRLVHTSYRIELKGESLRRKM
ncbi:MAG: ATP-binding protein [Draconibacterium sp.]